MKILIIQENGRHEENREFRECFNLQRSLISIGHDCVVWGLGHENFNEPIYTLINDCDAILVLENYDQIGWVPNLNEVNKLKLFWSIDSHLILPQHQQNVVKYGIDIVLNSIQSDQDKFNNVKTYYYPNAYPSDLIKPLPNILKKHLLGFCGSLLDRGNYIDRLRNDFGLHADIWKLGNSMVESINTYKIHFNKTLKNDINYRVFETMGTKTMLITNNTENLTNFFTDMEDIVIYNNDNELYDKLNYLRNNESEIYRIAENGYNNVIKNHTYNNRADRLIQIINENI
jgi:glycosyltransferase involved in cell wall biosynthesis